MPIINAFSSLTELKQQLDDGEITAVAIAAHFLERINRFDPQLASFVSVFEQRALDAAEGQDNLLAAGVNLGPLQGLPIGIKDLLHWQGTPCSAGSNLLKGVISDETAEVVKRLHAGGMNIVGKTQLVEFAFGGWGTNPRFTAPWNPWDKKCHRIPGGSSSGSAVAVAAGLVPASLGTDTGGSVRIPAALNGLVGLKPTQRRVSNQGCIPLSVNLDSIGPLTRTVKDAALLFELMSGVTLAKPQVGRMRVAILQGDMEGVAVEPEILQVFEKTQYDLRQCGIEVVAIKAPFSLPELSRLSGEIITADAYAYHCQDLQAHPESYDPVIFGKLMQGQSTRSQAYLCAMETRRQYQQAFATMMLDVDAILTPTLSMTAIPLSDVDEQKAALATFTRGVNYLDGCAISLPVALSSAGLPIGMQLIAAAEGESTLLALAEALERQGDWQTVPPGFE